MKGINTSTAVPDMYGPGKAGFRDGDPLSATPATRLNAEWFNGVQQEILNTIEDGGLIPAANDLTQLSTAIQAMIDAALAARPLPPSVPSGVVTMWSGAVAAIPTGWLLCDGTNETPDLRNRFVIGAGSTYAPKVTGGDTSATSSTAGAHAHNVSTGNTTLSVSQLAYHSHQYTDPKTMTDSGDPKGLVARTSAVDASLAKDRPTVNGGWVVYSGGNAAHSHTAATDSQGNHAHTVATLPPYYALCFIMKE